jgi:hypothetical protein
MRKGKRREEGIGRGRGEGRDGRSRGEGEREGEEGKGMGGVGRGRECGRKGGSQKRETISLLRHHDRPKSVLYCSKPHPSCHAHYSSLQDKGRPGLIQIDTLRRKVKVHTGEVIQCIQYTLRGGLGEQDSSRVVPFPREGGRKEGGKRWREGRREGGGREEGGREEGGRREGGREEVKS